MIKNGFHISKNKISKKTFCDTACVKGIINLIIINVQIDTNYLQNVISEQSFWAWLRSRKHISKKLRPECYAPSKKKIRQHLRQYSC